MTIDAGVVSVDAAPVAADPRPGYLSIDSRPWATIYVDGKRLGPTPQLKKPLAPGKHRIRAVTEDGREQTRTITIRAGRKAPPVILTW